jgi:hypothetical protein
MKQLAWAWNRFGVTRGVVRASVVLTTALLAGCGSSREVEVKGEVQAPSSIAVQGAIRVEFIDVTGDETADSEVVHSVELTTPGAFDEKVSLEGDKVLVRAINDSNDDGECSAGEAWGEAEAEIGEDDTVVPLTLTLANAPCPG